MAREDRRNIARQSYLAFARGDRSFFEAHLSEESGSLVHRTHTSIANGGLLWLDLASG